LSIVGLQSANRNLQLAIENLLRFFVICVLSATATKLTKLKPIRRGLFILSRNVVATLAVLTLKHNVISRHLLISNFRLPIAD
jgi:hypothetical protein